MPIGPGELKISVVPNMYNFVSTYFRDTLNKCEYTMAVAGIAASGENSEQERVKYKETNVHDRA